MIKQYPKVNADVYELDPTDVRPSRIGSTLGSAEELAIKFRELYREVQPRIFDFILKQVWLEQHFTYNNIRRRSRRGNGFAPDWAWGFFMHSMVGMSQKFAFNFTFTTVSTYLIDFFPDFMMRDPFKEPEYYKFPYEHLSLDHLSFVYMMHNRLEMLEYADKKKMKFAEFANWAYNWARCYNDDIGQDRYVLASNGYYWKHLKDTSLAPDWANAKFAFDMKK